MFFLRKVCSSFHEALKESITKYFCTFTLGQSFPNKKVIFSLGHDATNFILLNLYFGKRHMGKICLSTPRKNNL
uniref:Uncharacterized protein n=1 Tax=Anguilla anguilla TaxID=7936 RepID=A0A0E9TBY3_ANGAN